MSLCTGRKLTVALKAMKSGDTYIHFPSTSGEVEKERHLQLTEGLQVFSKPFPGEFFQGVLVALGSLFHFTFLIEGEHVKTHPWVEFTSQQRTPSPSPRMFLVVKVTRLHYLALF